MPVKLSIITVTYNAEAFIEATIKSVGEQSFSDKEFVVVDGKSKDQTVKILKKYPHIVTRYISEKDAGLYDAMNKAIHLAQGEYLMFLNAGDLFYDEEALSEVFSKANHPDLIYGDTAIINEQYELVGMRHLRPPVNLTYKSFLNGMVICHQAILAKKAIVPLYDTSYKVAADIDWAIRLTKNAQSTFFYPEPLIRFMQGGISTQHRFKGLQERFQVQKKYFGLLPTLVHTLWLGSKYILSLRFVKNVRRWDELTSEREDEFWEVEE